MIIPFNDIFTKCQDLSAYEAGRGTVDASLYNLVHITDRDKPFIRSYILEAVGNMSAILRFAITGFEMTDDNVDLQIVADTTLNTPKSVKLLVEVISTYVMSLWLANKLTERSQSYMSMYTELVNNLTKSVVRKRPQLDENY